MESALDVLSRAATMVQDNANEARLTTKELPTTKWRRDRRLRAGEYHGHHISATGTSTSSSSSPPGSGPLCESTNRPTPPPPQAMSATTSADILSHHSLESPIDMSVTSTTVKHHYNHQLHRVSPPPPYREPLPGSNFSSSLARPSVITQAPPKRDLHDNMLISNRENDNHSIESNSSCENVIDEHFRRSLGPDYIALFAKKSPGPNTTPSPQPHMGGVTTTSTPSPTLPTAMPQRAHHPAPAYHPTPHALAPHRQALISPKPTAVLLSPAAMVAAAAGNLAKCEQISPHVHAAGLPVMPLPPPQQQPLSLHRSNSPHRNASNSPQPLAITTTRPTVKSTPPLSAAAIDLHSTTHTPSPPPATHASPAPNVTGNNAALALTPTAVMPAIMRIKTEPGLAMATNTPPASPTSSSNASVSTPNSDVLASVDDHFAKALGETWRKLKEGKEIRK